MIKKLIALLLLSSAAHAFSPVRYVQISTNTLSKQSGAINISTEAVNVSSITYIYTSTITATSSATFTLAQISTLTVVSTGTFSNIGITTANISTATVGNLIISSNIVFNPTTTGIRGTTTNNNTNTGNYGEYISSNISSAANAPTSTQYGDLCNITLTAGDWDVSGVVSYAINGATWVSAQLGISQTSGNSATGLVLGDNYIANTFASSSVTPTVSIVSIPSVRESLSGTTTIYLKLFANYTGGPPTAVGRISARRAR